ncbi:MAG TPA: SDR family oxidoreductase [Blastocatellia bacterium]|nr:SDR family oxidoreductase [Blastocatellia bacterium]
MNILITGATGIAAATAKLAAQSGASIFIVSLHENECANLANEFRAAGGACEFYAGDLVNEATAIHAVQACVQHFGRIDSLFNVAGISGRKFGDGPLHECTENGWDMTMDTNAKTTFLMCRETLKQMLQQDVDDSGSRGAILNMASVLAFSPEPKHFAAHAYAASKGAIISLSKAMAAYYAPLKIRVNALAPGLIRTPMSQRAQDNPAIVEFTKAKQPLAEDLLDAEDVAKAALFLLGNESRHITGEVLTVDGGWNLR